MGAGAHEVPGLIQPTAAIQSTPLHNQSVALPVAARIPVPGGVVLKEWSAVGGDDANAMFRFSKNQNASAALNALQREWREHAPRHTVHVALANRVAFTMLIVVGCAFAHSRQIRKFSS